MNIFKEIIRIKKIKKSIKEAKKTVDRSKGLAEEVKKIIGNLKTDIEALLSCLPMLKPVYKEVIEIVKEVL